MFECVCNIVCLVLSNYGGPFVRLSLLITRSLLRFSSLRALRSLGDKLWDILSVVGIHDILSFIFLSRSAEEKNFCQCFHFCALLSGNFVLLLLLLLQFVCLDLDSDVILSLNLLKSANN